MQNDSTYFGATVGRVANRIGGAQFNLNGKHYKLVANEGNNTLHGMFNIYFVVMEIICLYHNYNVHKKISHLLIRWVKRIQ